jgi:hypothetical protein
MSCNYCSYQRILHKAEAEEKKAILSSRNANFGMGGLRVYVLPPMLMLPDIPDNELSKYDSGCWFMSVPDHCVCDDTDFDIPEY